jgi:mono/diheme cytochrome c family protein
VATLLGLFACDAPSDQQHRTAAAASEAAPSTSAAALASAPTASATAGGDGHKPPPRGASDPRLRFQRGDRVVAQLSRSAMQKATGSVTFRRFDPYYQRDKGFRALPCKALLEHAYAPEKLKLAEQHFVLVASDGYTVPLEGKRLLDPGCHVAIADLDAPEWEPIGPRRAHPGPFYLVWSGKGQADIEQYPRPWQLETVRIARFADSFPHVAPKGEPAGSPALRGFELFREQCIRCHAINQEGGKVGPDLNVPQSIVEYRPEEQIRAYIKNPRQFRYGNMPDNPHLDADDLDALIAYLTTMSRQKHDPQAKKGATP